MAVRMAHGWHSFSNVICGQDGKFRKVPFANVRATSDAILLPNAELNPANEESSGSGSPGSNIVLPVNLASLAVEDGWKEVVGTCWVNSANPIAGRCRRLFFGSSVYSVIPGKFDRGYSRFSGICKSSSRDISADQVEEDNSDPSRLNPMEYMVNADCRDAIAKEIDGLLPPDKTGLPPLIVIDRSQDPYRQRAAAKSTLVVRWKGPTRANARLCIRGDMLSIRDQVSAPTPWRSDVKTLLFLATSCNIRLAQIDISQSCLHADTMHEKDQLVADAPECVELQWKGVVLSRLRKPRQFSSLAF